MNMISIKILNKFWQLEIIVQLVFLVVNRFDSELAKVTDTVRSEKLQKEKLQREKDEIDTQKYIVEQELKV